MPCSPAEAGSAFPLGSLQVEELELELLLGEGELKPELQVHIIPDTLDLKMISINYPFTIVD